MPLAILFLMLLAAPAAAAPGTVVAELFTSQGCSSCPPGDLAFHQLWEQGDLDEDTVVLAYHVDYWNRLGWADPFSKAAYSQRQRGIARRLGLRQIYTPMTVLNGAEAHVTRGSPSAARRDLEAARRPPVGALRVRARSEGDALDIAFGVKLGPEAPAGPLRALVAVFESGLSTPVPRGENTGRTLRESWVVRHLQPAGQVPAEAGAVRKRRVRVPLEAGWDRERLGVAVLLEDASTGRILQARRGAVEAGGVD